VKRARSHRGQFAEVHAACTEQGGTFTSAREVGRLAIAFRLQSGAQRSASRAYVGNLVEIDRRLPCRVHTSREGDRASSGIRKEDLAREIDGPSGERGHDALAMRFTSRARFVPLPFLALSVAVTERRAR